MTAVPSLRVLLLAADFFASSVFLRRSLRSRITLTAADDNRVEDRFLAVNAACLPAFAFSSACSWRISTHVILRRIRDVPGFTFRTKLATSVCLRLNELDVDTAAGFLFLPRRPLRAPFRTTGTILLRDLVTDSERGCDTDVVGDNACRLLSRSIAGSSTSTTYAAGLITVGLILATGLSSSNTVFATISPFFLDIWPRRCCSFSTISSACRNSSADAPSVLRRTSNRALSVLGQRLEAFGCGRGVGAGVGGGVLSLRESLKEVTREVGQECEVGVRVVRS